MWKIVILLLILVLIYYKLNKKKENLTNDEAITNLASLYNNSNMTVTNMSVTGNIVARDYSGNNIDLSGNLNVGGNVNSNGNLTIKNISANSLNINDKFIIDASGTLRSIDSNKKPIGMRVFWIGFPRNVGRSSNVYYKIIDPDNNSYNANDWFLTTAPTMDNPGTSGFNYGEKYIPFVNKTENTWYLMLGACTGTGNYNTGPCAGVNMKIQIIAYPKNFFETIYAYNYDNKTGDAPIIRTSDDQNYLKIK